MKNRLVWVKLADSDTRVYFVQMHIGYNKPFPSNKRCIMASDKALPGWFVKNITGVETPNRRGKMQLFIG